MGDVPVKKAKRAPDTKYLAFLLLIKLENVQVVMRSSAGGRMMAGDKANATMQHAAREKQMYTNHVPGTCDVRTAALCTYFVYQVRTNVKSRVLLLFLVRV